MRQANPGRLDAALVLLVAVVKVFCALPNDEANICKVATGKLGPVRTWTRVALPAELDNFSQRRPLGFCHFTTHTQTLAHTHGSTHTATHSCKNIIFINASSSAAGCVCLSVSQSSSPSFPSPLFIPPPSLPASACPSALSTVVCRGENVFYICQINETHTRQSIGKFFCSCLTLYPSLSLTLSFALFRRRVFYYFL